MSAALRLGNRIARAAESARKYNELQFLLIRFPRVRDIRATCHTLRLAHVQGNRQAPCGRIVPCSGAFSLVPARARYTSPRIFSFANRTIMGIVTRVAGSIVFAAESVQPLHLVSLHRRVHAHQVIMMAEKDHLLVADYV